MTPYVPPPLQRKRFSKAGVAIVVLFTIAFVAILIRGVTVLPPQAYAPPVNPFTPPGSLVSYNLTCCGYANVTYINASGGTEQQFVKAPWTMEFHAVSGRRVYISAQSNDYGVILTLKLDGGTIQNAESFQHFGVASVGGIIP
jgi:hypothetical protein